MIDVPALRKLFLDRGLVRWAEVLPEQIRTALAEERHGDLGRWEHILAMLPEVNSSDLALDADRVRVGRAVEVDASLQEEIRRSLRALQPWRKGPFEVFGIHVDSEWRSDFKWARLA
ncbi:MAG TPA: DUF1698 domain-containing protein, partial [Chromatiaceae bacterium]|nr:DUF1698 domain-containing protein [Chromatiaceae bacterium]